MALCKDGGSSVSAVNEGRLGSVTGSALVSVYVGDTFTAPGIGLGGTKTSSSSVAEGLLGVIFTINGDSSGVTGAGARAGAGFVAATGISDNASRDGGGPREATAVGDGVEVTTLLFDDGSSLECSISGATAG